MKEPIKIFSGIASSVFVRWVMIMGLGYLVCLLSLIISVILISNNGDSGYAGARAGGVIGMVLTFFLLFLTEFWSALLLVISLLFTTVYFAIANKFALRTTIYKAWQLKANDFLKRKIEIYSEKLSDGSPHWLKEMGTPLKVKLQLMDQISKDKEASFIQKRVLRFGLKMISLDDVDMSKDNVRFSEIVYAKIDQHISTMSRPSLRWFYIALLFQLFLIILAFLFDA
jgi:hypothetical protein